MSVHALQGEITLLTPICKLLLQAQGTQSALSPTEDAQTSNSQVEKGEQRILAHHASAVRGAGLRGRRARRLLPLAQPLCQGGSMLNYLILCCFCPGELLRADRTQPGCFWGTLLASQPGSCPRAPSWARWGRGATSTRPTALTCLASTVLAPLSSPFPPVLKGQARMNLLQLEGDGSTGCQQNFMFTPSLVPCWQSSSVSVSFFNSKLLTEGKGNFSGSDSQARWGQ